jgi:hypothetical protein
MGPITTGCPHIGLHLSLKPHGSSRSNGVVTVSDADGAPYIQIQYLLHHVNSNALKGVGLVYDSSSQASLQ